MKKLYIILSAVFLLLFIVYQLHTLHHPVHDNDEGIYATTFALIEKGNAPYKTTFLSQPPGFLIAVYPFFTYLGSSLSAARLGILFWSFIGMVTLIWICFKAKKPYAGFLAVALLPFISVYLSQTQTLQSDILVSTFSVLSLAFFLLFFVHLIPPHSLVRRYCPS